MRPSDVRDSTVVSDARRTRAWVPTPLILKR